MIDLGKLIVAKGFKKLPKDKKNRLIWSHWLKLPNEGVQIDAITFNWSVDNLMTLIILWQFEKAIQQRYIRAADVAEW